MTIAVFLGSLLAAMALGVPIAFSLLLCGAALMWHMNMFDAQILAQNVIEGANSFPLLAVPFFMLAGEVMNTGGLSRRIVEFAMALVGHIRGGLGYVTIVAACLLSALSGSAVADAAALTALLLPMMVKAGHDKARSGGLIAACGVIGPIIPPSIGQRVDQQIVFGWHFPRHRFGCWFVDHLGLVDSPRATHTATPQIHD
jgi:TRAP-type transport system large permease protein